MNAKLISAVLALVASAALADGVPLITAGPPLAANDPARQLQATKLPNFVKLHPVVVNRAAFGANVVTAVVDGKEYRFVGALMPKAPAPPKAVTEKQPNMQSWSGMESGGGMLVLSKDMDNGSLLGSMSIQPGRNFVLVTPPNGSAVMVESADVGGGQLNYVSTAASGVPPNSPAPSASGGTR